MANTHRQLSSSVRNPPSSGPNALPSPATPSTSPPARPAFPAVAPQLDLRGSSGTMAASDRRGGAGEGEHEPERAPGTERRVAPLEPVRARRLVDRPRAVSGRGDRGR